MNQEQADKIIAVIEKDATGRGCLFPTDDTECGLGGLWLAMGEERDPNQYRSRKMCQFYHYTERQETSLWETNDAYDTIPERRIALISLVNSWVE